MAWAGIMPVKAKKKEDVKTTEGESTEQGD